MSEIYNFLRLLFAKAGEQFCPEHPKQLVSNIKAENLLNNVKSFGSETIKLLAPVIKQKKGHHRAVFIEARKQEIEEVRVDGKFGSISKFEEGLSRNQLHDIEYVLSLIHI